MPIHDPRFPYRNELEMPVIGMEAEFKVFLDDEAVTPEEVWKTPSAFIDRPLLQRTSKSSQLPTGGAVYFDGGVIEVVTPVIEIAPQCTARVVRSVWEQIEFVRGQLDRWEAETNRRVRLEAFSSHLNISFELGRDERGRNRTIQKLALLLAHILPVPTLLLGANRRSTGIGVRPRRDRVEVTMDFTPDPGLMSATMAMITGIAREVISWPSYRIDDLPDTVPRLIGVEPGRHPTRKGWVVRDYHFPRNPFQTRPNDPVWETTLGLMSLRQIAMETAMAFRDSIRRHADPFSYRVLFSVLRGETPSLLDLGDRPSAYEDVGRLTRWGSVLPELGNFASIMFDETGPLPRRRKSDLETRVAPPWREEHPLTRSAYERVFRRLGSRNRLRIEGETLTPVSVKGWYHSVFVTPDGEERMLSIDQILHAHGQWRE